MVGVDPIPILEDFRLQVEDTLKLEDKDLTPLYIRQNKHNHVTTTYYLLMKKVERENGKNLVFERVTKEKRSYKSTGNLGSSNP